jgi:hypothetical protein
MVHDGHAHPRHIFSKANIVDMLDPRKLGRPP